MEVPRPGVQSAYTTATAMPNPSRICNLHLSLQQHWILNPLSKARDQTLNLVVLSRIHFCCTMTGTPQLFDNSHFYRCEVIFHYGFHFYFPDDKWCWTTFHVSVTYLYIFPGKMTIHVLCKFFNQGSFLNILTYISSLYILDIIPYKTSFISICSYSVGSPCILTANGFLHCAKAF